MSDLLQKLERIEREFPEYLKGALKRMPIVFQGYIGAEMNFKEEQRDAVAFAPSSSDKLDLGSGALYKSFKVKNKNNYYKENDDGFEIGSKLPYATIHEYGGFIKSKGRMHKFFWAKWLETGSPYYKRLFFAVLKNKGVTIKARPYFHPAEKKFEEEGVPKIENIILKRIAAIINE